MKPNNIAIGCDHAGSEMKEKVRKWLEEQRIDLKDFGTYSEQSVDYPDFAHKVSLEVEAGNFELGILICGTGIGVDMVANKHQGIRSALCWQKEIGQLAKTHNNANVICLPGRFISFDEARDILSAFFENEFEGGRHQGRIDKISC
jgi:ribose 5-phosphate isomerase B